jgi:hypothetical protein
MVPADAAPAAQEPTPGDVQPGPETRPRKRRRSVDEPTNDGESMAKKKKVRDLAVSSQLYLTLSFAEGRWFQLRLVWQVLRVRGECNSPH